MALDSSAQTGWKVSKEAFVSGHSGTSLLEVTAAASAMPLLTLAMACQPHHPLTGPWALLAEFALLVGAPLLVLTEQTTTTTVQTAACLLSAAVALLAWRLVQCSGRGEHNLRQRAVALSANDRLSCLVWYRSGLLVMTAIAILAVDFPVFPRRFAKAENYGSGLMDVGVGSFLIAQGIVRGAGVRAQARVASWRSTASSVLPCVVIGVARLLAVKSVDYQEHVSEYGVHWNFFFTLGITVLLSRLLPVPHGWCWRGSAGVLLLTLHQAMLTGGVSAVVMAAERGPSLVSLNKEGIATLPGYLSLHCLGECFGGCLRAWLRWCSGDGTEYSGHGAAGNLGVLAAGCALLWVATVAVGTTVEPISRRSCNAAYVLWVSAHNASAILLYLTAELVMPATGLRLHLSEALSNGMLVAFLLSNLLTGAVNLCIDTLNTSDPEAVVILAIYMGAVCAASYAFGRMGLSLRLPALRSAHKSA